MTFDTLVTITTLKGMVTFPSYQPHPKTLVPLDSPRPSSRPPQAAPHVISVTKYCNALFSTCTQWAHTGACVFACAFFALSMFPGLLTLLQVFVVSPFHC